LDNSLKHSQGSIRVTAGTEGEQVAISVIDQGPGMPPEILQHVFDRFYRSETVSKVPGFGLGLPIAKALVEGQGGKIEIESLPENGSVVKMVFPI
jgi:signal transduction histidine kinase